MEINNEHIKEAEELLIGGQEFDENERIPFIKNFESIDLLAVPGSGKTTALLAKLYCLSKQLPFRDGSAVLILSHTNAAVDEIEKHLKPFCPMLFTYPNFIGTIQGFVNKFLANNACLTKYGSYITINDKDIYENEASKFFNGLQWINTEPKGLKNKLFGKLNQGQNNLTSDQKIENIKIFLKYFELDIIDRKVKYNDSSFYTYTGTSQSYYLELEGWKESLFKKGILNYKDSFYLGNWYIKNYPFIIEILQKRFKYVFIDEMQDLEQFQIDIIDMIFASVNSNTILQRIGDINQAIYNSSKKVKVQADWKPRNQMYLNNSNRLTSEIASIVNFFTLDRQQDGRGNPRFVVNGLRQNSSPIQPHLIVYNDQTKGNLESTFLGLIKDYSLHSLPEAEKYGFKIIGWNAKWNDDEVSNNKLRLENIFPRYKKDSTSSKENFNSLSKYLQLFDKTKRTLEPARKAILNSLIAILRIENKTYQTTIRSNQCIRFFTKDELISVIKKRENLNDYETLKSRLCEWSFSLMVKNQCEEVYSGIKAFILNEFNDWFELALSEATNEFIGEQFEKIESTLPQNEDINPNDIKIDIGTVHSAKGQTHCGTMYVETSYYDYETNKLKVVSQKQTARKAEVILPNPILGKEHSYRIGKDIRAKESMKMMYVGFSRPTHLLCFAVLKDNMTYNYSEYENAGWRIIDLTS